LGQEPSLAYNFDETDIAVLWWHDKGISNSYSSNFRYLRVCCTC